VILGSAPPLILAVHNYSEHSELTGSLVREKALLTAGQVQLGLENISETTRQLLTSLAKDPAVENLELAACKRILEDCYGKRPFLFYSNIGMADTEGNVLCSAVPYSGTINVSDRQFFQQAVSTREFSLGGFQIGRMTGKTIVSFAFPIIDKSGALKGVLFTGVDLSWLNRLVAAADLPSDSTLTVIDREGTVLSRNLDPEQWVGRAAPDAEIVRACLTKNRGTVDAYGIDGIRKVYGFTTLTQFPRSLHVYVGVPEETLLAKSQELFLKHVMWLGIAFGLGLGAVWGFAYLFLMRKTGTVIAAARRLGQGDLSARTGLKSDDGEIGELGVAFDRMADDLSARQAEREKAQKLLAKEKEISDVILSGLPGVFYFFDREGKFRRWNKAFEILSGSSAEEISRMHPLQFIGEKDRKLAEGAIARVFGTGEAAVEASWLMRGGTEVPYYFTGKRIEIDGKEHLVGMGVDISARKKAEKDLARSEQMLKDILDTSPVGINLAENRVVKWANKSWMEMFGFEHGSEYEGKDARILYDSDAEYERVGRALYENIRHRTPAETDAVLRRTDGTLFDAHVRANLTTNSDPADRSIITAISDISDRKRAEITVKESEARFRSLFDFAPDAYFLNDMEGRLVDCNLAAEQILGHRKEELVGKNFIESGILSPDLASSAVDLLKSSARGEAGGPTDLVFVRKDGRALDVEIRTVPIKLKGNVVVLGLGRDITQRKLAEELIRRSEHKYRLLVENANELICVVQDGRFVHANSKAIRESGYSLEELTGMTFLDVVHPDDRDVPLVLYQKAMTGAETSDACVFRLIDKWGRTRWGHASVVRVEWNSRPAAMVLGIDITVQKEAEEEIRRNEQTLKGILAACPVGIDLAGPDRTIRWANESWMRMFGFNSEALIAHQKK